jgi:transposase
MNSAVASFGRGGKSPKRLCRASLLPSRSTPLGQRAEPQRRIDGLDEVAGRLRAADRFSSSRKAVRFIGLDITVRSSDSKRSPGRLSRQGPEVLRWLLFEAAKNSARSCAPGHSYYTDVKQRYDANRASLSQARRIVRQAMHILADLGDDAFTIIAQPAAPTMIAR